MDRENPGRARRIDKLLLKGGRVCDPGSGIDQAADLVIVDGIVKDVGRFEDSSFDGRVVKCPGVVIAPGFIDMHVHLREPGREDEETIESGCRAAMAGGFTAVCCMPNTQPPLDNRSQIEFVRERASGFLVDVHPIGAITKGQKGEEITEMGDMVQAGAIAFSDDGHGVEKSLILRRALEYTKMFDCPIIEHCEDHGLSEGGMINESFLSTTMGLKGIPSVSEDVMVARDLLLAEFTGGPLHIAHVSTLGAVRMIREAKKRGVRVTAETCPHYIVLTEEAVRNYNTQAKMKPPLRSEADRKAVVAGLKDGTIDAISTDHAPHSVDEKDTEFDAAAFGIVGLETAVPLVFTHLVGKKILTLAKLVEAMAIQPRRLLGLPANPISKGKPANLSLFDPEVSWTIDKNRFQSKSRNTPFDGWTVRGAAIGVINNRLMHWNSRFAKEEA